MYVDYIILTGDDEAELKKLKCILAKEFKTKYLGPLKYFLGIEVAKSKRGITIAQGKYLIYLLKEIGMLSCKPVATPIEQNIKFGTLGESPPMHKGIYPRLMEKLIYLSHIRPHTVCSECSESVYKSSHR